MQHPDEGLIHTWLDGELSDEQAASFETHIAECADCSAKVAEARGLIAASSRIVTALDLVPAGVIPGAAPKRRSWYQNTQLRAAAAVMIVAGASLLVMQNRDKSAMDRVMSTAAPPRGEVARDTVASGRDSSRPSATAADAVAPTPKPMPTRTPQKNKKCLPAHLSARRQMKVLRSPERLRESTSTSGRLHSNVIQPAWRR
jgi:anti-sigma factor RsiW